MGTGLSIISESTRKASANNVYRQENGSHWYTEAPSEVWQPREEAGFGGGGWKLLEFVQSKLMEALEAGLE